MSFRTKTALTIAVLTLLALGSAFAVVWATFSGLQRRQLDESLLAVANDEAAEAPANGFEFDSRPGPATNDVGPLTKYGVIYDEKGRVLSATPPFDTAPPPPSILNHALSDPFNLRFRAEHLRGVLVAIPGNSGNLVFLATSRKDLDVGDAFLARAMLSAFLVAVAWVSAVAYWMGGRLTRDHHAIAEVARKVAKGDLSAKVRVRSGDPEVAQLSRDINEMMDRLGELLATQERFVAHAAHELRSPLTALYGELQHALRKERDADGYKRAIEAAFGATRRLKLLADDLLTLARTRADGAAEDVPVPLEAALAEACSSVNPFAEARAVKVAIERSPSCRIFDRNGDAARLFRNLLENAVRHSPEGGVVSLAATVAEGTIQVEVRDQGPGVNAKECEAIFEPFFRSKGSTRTEGAGLGLGIAREIARAHGGEIVVDPRDCGGARFVVSLPAVEAPAP